MPVEKAPSKYSWKKITAVVIASFIAASTVSATYWSHVVSQTQFDSVSQFMEWTNNGDQYFATLKWAWGILFIAILVFAADGREVFTKFRGVFLVMSLAALIESVHDKISVWTAVFLSAGITVLGFYLARRGKPQAPVVANG